MAYPRVEKLKLEFVAFLKDFSDSRKRLPNLLIAERIIGKPYPGVSQILLTNLFEEYSHGILLQLVECVVDDKGYEMRKLGY